ncbi:hypothetical protein PCANB_000628 [Pneumocystis canis]|nr:hypothetical protein PCK1_000734 [Pneumocystis canis]KAG5437591.1 hypothetical protein PCANB_000628 [Pneumocystis canis]
MDNYIMEKDNKTLLSNLCVKGQDQKIDIVSISVIDFLSSSNEFKSLIKGLQHARLIGYLNALRNITFIAPTEKAFDNKTKLTADILKYHILNGLFLTNNIIDGFVFRSHMYISDGQEGFVGVKVKEMINVNTGEKNINIGDVSIVRGNYITRNGIVQVTNKIMILPKDIYSLLSSDSDLSMFIGMIDHEILKSKKITIFAPSNKAFKIFNDVEHAYLQSKYGVSDLKLLISNHLQTNTVIYKNDIIDKMLFKSDANEILNATKNATGFYVSGHKITEYDIIAKNGVIHKISDLLLPKSLEFTPFKYLYGMDTKIFADEIFVAGLQDLIKDKTIEQTIFAPIDSSLYLSMNIKNGQYIQEIKYHFICNWFDINSLKDQKLLTTKMRGKLLGGKNQKIKISRKNGKIWLNDRSMVLGSPFIIGKTQIYRIDSELTSPLSFPAAAAPMFHISKTMEYLYNTNIDIQLHNKESLTYFVPLNSAWENLGLVQDYLILDSSKNILREVLLNTIFNDVLYFEDFLSNITVSTLRGISLTIQKNLTGFSILFQNNSYMFEIDKYNILLENGVAHTVSRVFMPPNLIITPQNLLSTKNISLFLQLLESTDLFYVLNPEEKFTILAPIDTAWDTVISKVRNYAIFQQIIKLHLLPPLLNNSDFLEDPNPRLSLHKKKIKISALKIHDSLYHIFFYSSKTCHQQISIIGEGKTTFHGQILIIDRVLQPDCAINIFYIYILLISFLLTIVLITIGFFIRKILLRSYFSERMAVIVHDSGSRFSKQHISSYWGFNKQYSDERRPLLYFHHPSNRSLSRPVLTRTLTV